MDDKGRPNNNNLLFNDNKGIELNSSLLENINDKK